MKPKRSLSVVGLCFFLMVGFSGQVGAFSEEDLKKLKETGECIDCDLSGADLSWLDLTGANLAGANLISAKLTGAILTTISQNHLFLCSYSWSYKN